MSSTHGVKLSALLLAGWSARDRRWALTQLASHQREAVTRMLAELKRSKLPPLGLEPLRHLAANSAGDSTSTVQELTAITSLLDSLPPRWASRVLQAWKVSSTDVPSLLKDPVRADAVGRELGQPRPPMPPRLAAALRDLSARHSNVLAFDAHAIRSRHG